jgi:TPR repeat protein
MDSRSPKYDNEENKFDSFSDEGYGFFDFYHNPAKVKYDEGVSYFEKNDYAKALELLYESASLGYSNAQFKLADCYQNGYGMPTDIKKAIEWYQLSADQDHIDAQFNLATIYRLGDGIEKDYKQAYGLYWKAAQKGDAPSQYYLGRFLQKGLGVEKDAEQAAYWYSVAARNNDAKSIYQLALCYKNGEGVEKNLEIAFSLYALLGTAESFYQQALILEQGGYGIERNTKRSEKYFLIAAKKGHAHAIEKLKDTHHFFIEKMNINSLLLAIRYKDSKKILDAKKEENSPFHAFIKTMLLGYGSTHSAQGSGLLLDLYHREALDDLPNTNITDVGEQRKSTLFSHLTQTAENKIKGQSSLVPLVIENTKSINNVLHSEFKKYLDNTVELNVSERKFQIISVEPQMYRTMNKALGNTGHFPTKDAQLWIVANSIEFNKIFIELFSEMNPAITPDKFHDYLMDISYQPSKCSPDKIKENVLKILSTVEKQAYSGQQFFYANFFSHLIKSMDISSIQERSKSEQAQLALSRLEYILYSSIKNIHDYDIFLTYLEYAFDELIFLNTLTGKYKVDNIKNTLTIFLQDQYMLDQKSIPVHAALGGSGMNLLSKTISTAIEEIKEDKEFKNGCIYVQKKAYYEIPLYLGYKLNQKMRFNTPNDIFISFDRHNSKINNENSNELMDIMICAFQENISAYTSSFGSKDIHQLIKDQLDLRDKLKSNKRLITIIDTTIHPFDDDKMSSLLMVYEDAIASGQLAILTVHSLNKYFHMGFDKTPGALSAGFYKDTDYPAIAALYEKEWLSGYHKEDPTPQMIAFLVDNLSEEILEFHQIIKRNSRYIHEELAHKKMMDSSRPHFISIYHPYTDDIYKDVSGFFTFKINNSDELKFIYDVVKEHIMKMLPLINIKGRDGYGYSKTTSSLIVSYPFEKKQTVFRLSIGTESKENLKKTLEPLINYFSDVNELVSIYAKKLPDQCLEEINKLNEKYMDELNSTEIKHIPKKSGEKDIAAHQNHIDAIRKLAKCYEYGLKDNKTEIIQKNIEKAAKLYVKAAMLGDIAAESQFKLAACYQKGMGVEKNQNTAEQLARKAEKWYIEKYEYKEHALFKLALLYEKGEGLFPKDEKRAVELYQQATVNHTEAQYRLGLCFQKGVGIPKNEEQAITWFKKAAKKDHMPAQQELKKIMANDPIFQGIYKRKS